MNFSLGSLSQRMNPEVYAQQYANQNGISLQEAREELRVQHGEPQKEAQNQSLFTSVQNENFYTNIDLNDIDFSEFEEENDNQTILSQIINLFSNFTSNNEMLPKADPEEYAEQYAQENDISIEEAREELKAKYGEPQPGFNPFMA